MLRLLSRCLVVAALVPTGVATALTGVTVSRMDQRWFEATWPLGLLFVAVVTWLMFWSAGQLGQMLGTKDLGGRAYPIAAAVGWFAGVAFCLWPRGEGDVLIASDGTGIVFLLTGVIAACWVMVRTDF